MVKKCLRPQSGPLTAQYFCLHLLLHIIFILSTTKKLSVISFCPRFEICVLIVSTLVFAFEIIRPLIFCAESKFSTIKDVFHIEGTFPHSSNFFTFKEFFRIQGTFPHSRYFSTFKKLLHNQKKFPHSRNFSTVKKVL